MEPTYALRTSADTVEAWSTVRLPFEPKGRMLEFRTELRAALRSLDPAAGAQLHAVYGATDDGQFVDTENVLLYNVGTAALRHLTDSAVTFERAFTYPPPPDKSDLPPAHLHYQRYAVEAPTELQLSLLAAGAPESEILEDYPYLTSDDVRACLEYAAAQADHAILVAS